MYTKEAQPGYAGIKTFFGANTGKFDEIGKGSIYVLGVPFDATVTSRPGARYGPGGIREASMSFRYHLNTSEQSELLNIHTGNSLNGGDLCKDKLVDLGDVNVHPSDVEKTANSVSEAVSTITKVGGFPVLLGGDHYITYPSFRGFAKGFENHLGATNGELKIGYIQIDAHLDLSQESEVFGKHYNGANARLISDLDWVNPSNMVWIGTRGYVRKELWEFAENQGATIFSEPLIRDKGIETVVKESVEKVSQNTDIMYVSIDIDVVKAAFAQGTGAITFGGISSSELLRAMKVLSQFDEICGIDMMEVAPNLDNSGRTASLAAASLLEFLTPKLN